jgi:hypothetical protein
MNTKLCFFIGRFRLDWEGRVSGPIGWTKVSITVFADKTRWTWGRRRISAPFRETVKI